ncbi:hypothetical protein [Methylobacterium gregans]|uniref:Relaxase/mobilization nuclease family protein n=1 Tax=Methylobacterium gregans TaxID=374424 RepID=A0AA37MAX0_9HYPH|nr:hypothetical protein [Methylobacterium gregans]MDQ0520304.1 hypothetical protein [Methylobacterium gregans]GJD78511.1 hypothetical protein NBEOAGPD_1727 [Methylobacterium gregans]GLS52707.1 hypothetical protein GCM10007886_08900 [Methylobacterium gregans]
MQHVRHGRTARDARNLSRHLLRLDGNASVAVVRIIGLAATDLPGALAAMRRLAPRTAAAAFHHISLAPSGTCSVADLSADADRAMREMGADPAIHPHALVVHGKASVAGRAPCHAHLVVAHWGLEGRALDDSWLHLRLERVAREIEHDRGEPLTPGRHDRALARALRARGRPEVAAALEAAAADGPPRSATTPGARQRLRRAGVDDVAARAAVKAAWAAATGPTALRDALAGAGLSLAPGGKPGVWTVLAAGGAVVGALDRIVKQKRAVVATRMEEPDDRIDPTYLSVAAPIPAALPGDPEPDPDHRHAHGPADGAPRPVGDAGGTVTPGGPARDAGRDPGGPARGGGPARSDRGSPAAAGPAPAPGRRNRIREAAAAHRLARGLNLTGIREEAARRYLAARLAELEGVYRRACQERDAARAPLPEPAAVAEARALEAQAGEEARRVHAEAEAAEARRAALAALTPTGWRRPWWWMRGWLRPHLAALAEATTAARNARDMAVVHARIVSGRAFGVEVEVEKAMRRRPTEVQLRREAEARAVRTMEHAAIAADLLRADPDRGALPVPDLLRLAETERRRRQVVEDAREALEVSSGPQMGPR